MKRKIRVGIVGANANRGWGSTVHLPALRALSDHYQVTALCNSTQASADEAARKFGIAHAFSNPSEMARHPEVDLVSVTVKVPTHYDLVTAALQAGKHVMCEWPLAQDSAKAQRMLELAQQKGVVHALGVQARFAPVIQRVRDLVRDGYVGRVLSVTLLGSVNAGGNNIDSPNAYIADVKNGANTLSIIGGHSIDALAYCLGEFRELSATLAVQAKELKVVDKGSTVPNTSPDQIVVNGILESGAAASIHIQGNTVNATRLLFEINGTVGDLRITSKDKMSLQMSDLRLEGVSGPGAQWADLDVPESHYWVPRAAAPGPIYNVAQLYAKLAQSITEGKPADPDFAVGLQRHRMLDAIVAAAQTGQRQFLKS